LGGLGRNIGREEGSRRREDGNEEEE